MLITFEEKCDDIIFRVSKFHEKYEKILKMCFYEADGESYIKKFSKDIKNIDKIKANYKKSAEKMFSQLGYFEPIPWEDALLEFVKRLNGKGVDWWLTGSCAACIRGIPLNPHDVDIMIDSKYVSEISGIFSDCLVEPIVDTKGWVTKDFGVIFCHARIDIASDPSECLDEPEPSDSGPYAKQHLERIKWKGYEIKVPPLNLQLSVNKRRERMDRVKLIEEYINKNIAVHEKIM
ncbi:nucleotidyltransferase domain-containing protein [Clostridium neuense]|uniref:Nucleotidyltransferase domain-containing protein n=1 Tax=Clostridium neuense TaxID=1728934 RepID=A0ABW8TEW0_9CLOT